MKIGGQIEWNVAPICETSQIYYLTGRRPIKDVLGNHLKDQSFSLVHWLSITLSLRKSCQRWNRNSASASNVSGFAGSHGPGSSNDMGIRDADLIFPQALPMNMREEPSCYDFHVNSTILELRTHFGKGPTYLSTINLLRSILRQVPCRSGLYLKHEAKVKTLLLDIKMMVFPMRLTVPFSASKQRLLCANPDQLRTGRLESNLQLCGECWQINSKFSSLMGMTTVHL